MKEIYISKEKERKIYVDYIIEREREKKKCIQTYYTYTTTYTTTSDIPNLRENIGPYLSFNLQKSKCASNERKGR